MKGLAPREVVEWESPEPTSRDPRYMGNISTAGWTYWSMPLILWHLKKFICRIQINYTRGWDFLNSGCINISPKTENQTLLHERMEDYDIGVFAMTKKRH